MKNQKFFDGIILIGFGLYYYFSQNHIQIFKEYITWPTLFMIVGIAFLVQGYNGKNNEAILPGVIFTGFGFHFHVVHKLAIWPNNIGVLLLIISLGFLLQYQRTRNGLFQGLLFLALSIILLFYDKLVSTLGLLENRVESIWKYSPIALVIIGIILLFRKK
ncbi:DUF5668 domain-containing protein [Bacillus sp. FJAT-49736]|uniref:LiaI-LiaF-like domain-containing protein n=1 Tax=Bacillus sp. FJAT-49736 TaxID=2833582 RepID=UPI001BC9A451|nr:DUF5668 domain-containing protein [Bacillus sp. FJAT-49736]MBS4173730.1 hypothetical protein [Bacillus sp. FJAT-49736]